MLVIVKPGAACEQGKAQKEIREGVAGDRSLVEKGNEPARLNVPEGVLLQRPEIKTELHQMTSPHVRDIVQHLKSVGNAVLRVVEFVSQRGKPRNRDETEAEVPGVGGKFRQTHLAVKARAHVFMKRARGHTVEGEAGLVDQRRGKNMVLPEHEILRAARNVCTETRHPREAGAGKRLIKTTIGEAVPENEIRGVMQGVIDAHIEAIVPVPEHRGGYKVLTCHGQIWRRVQMSNGPADAINSPFGDPPARKLITNEIAGRVPGNCEWLTNHQPCAIRPETLGKIT